jgi:hypothetical protein
LLQRRERVSDIGEVRKHDRGASGAKATRTNAAADTHKGKAERLRSGREKFDYMASLTYRTEGRDRPLPILIDPQAHIAPRRRLIRRCTVFAPDNPTLACRHAVLARFNRLSFNDKPAQK